MKDFDVVVNAVRQLNQVWAMYRDSLVCNELQSDIYNALADFDESINCLIAKTECSIAELTD